MKKIFFCIIALVMLSASGNAQSAERKLACVTFSCCGVGIFGVEIWSHKVCVSNKQSASGNDYVLHFDAPKVPSVIEVSEDRYIGVQDIKGNYIVLPAGKYNVTNNEISFTNVPNNSRFSCHALMFHHSGSLLGHDYEFNSYIVICGGWKMANTGFVKIDLKLNAEQLTALKESNYEFSLTKDLSLTNKNIVNNKIG